MTTPANNGPHGGANQPEDDDPFGYLYADGQAAGATPPGQGGGYGYPGPTGGGQPGAQPGVPRTSYNQVRTVGERTYGGQRGAVPQQQPAPSYQAQYQAPEALQAGGYGVPQQPQYTQQSPLPGGGHGGHGGGGSSRKGLLIAAVAVVAAVAIGISAALIWGNNDKDKGDKNQASNQSQQPVAPQPNQGSGQPSGSPTPSQAPLPKGEAAGAGMALTGGAVLQNTVLGSKSSGGQYVGNFNVTGAALTWTVDVPEAGEYTLHVNYAVPGKDAKTTLTVNGQSPTQSLNLANFAKAEAGAWDKGWTRTYAWINLKKGSNTMKISCEAGNQCEVIFDQLGLAQGHTKR
ncbi:CBM35 domain-containing protein [Streptomyces sp. NBC_00091]|uniref:CBM35 domain-containing protein n=1 Tax=Streptomyces sp. NBC_00091 TaxID=2975648 RepID=UPI0022569B2C|nr:CBM35 domain-containing protein [Streptomyces sp. NBC_00091]MCX5376868.1 carbohydrate-binding protein [Streptomyces sp. NBC_00091]